MRVIMFERFDRPVRCSAGHLYTTIWVPFGSLKAVRLGWKRYQHCPVGHHWATVGWGDVDSMSEEERVEAAKVHDLRIP